MQRFLRTPWNATSRTTARDALWQHILNTWPSVVVRSVQLQLKYGTVYQGQCSLPSHWTFFDAAWKLNCSSVLTNLSNACQTTLLLRDSLSLSRSFLLWLQPWSLSTIMLLWHTFLIIIIIIILDRNTSSQPFMTPCVRQVMNRIPGNVTPPWAGCWELLHSCSMSRAIYLVTSTEEPTTSKADPPPRPRPTPSHPGKATPYLVLHWPAIWNHLHIKDSCGFQWRDVDAVTPEFPQNLHNTSPQYFCHPTAAHCCCQ